MPANINDNLSVGLCNIQGGLTGLTKTLELQELIFREKLDIIGINETNLKSDIDSSTLNFPKNFDLLRCDRQNESGRGGCGLLINRTIQYKSLDLNITSSDVSKIEAVWIHLLEANLHICCFYRSHNFCKLDTFLDYMTECMMKLQGKKVMWIGDVNVDQSCIKDLDYKKLDITMKLFGMIQTITGITRIANLNGRITKSTIDVVITNCYSHFLECSVLEDRIGDHQALKCTLDFKVSKANKFQKILIRNQSLHNLKALQNYLGYGSDYSEILACHDVDQATNGLNHHIKTAYEHFCPVKQIKCNSNYLLKPSKELLAAIKKKKALHRKYKTQVNHLQKIKCKCSNICKCRKRKIKEVLLGKCNKAWEIYRVQRNFTTKLSREARCNNIIQDLTVKSLKNDIKGIWKTIKHAANLPSKNEKAHCSNLNINAVNLHFSTIGHITQQSIISNENDNPLNYMPPPTNYRFSAFEEVTADQVKEYVASIPSDKSINDIMPMRVYKYVIHQIVEPFTHLINLSLKTGVMPAACKIASVAPILKNGNPMEPNNYRPISILPLLGKSIEYFVNKQFTAYIEEHNLLSDQQYGFRKNHSTTFLMLDLFDKIFKAKETHKRPAIIFLDVKKAFDTVNHNVLLKKLKHYGVDGFVIKWFDSFLSDRLQFTKLNGTASSILPVNNGVPQGSILGPVLFSLFINDLSRHCIDSIAFLFADDCALYFNQVKRGDWSNIVIEMRIIYEWFRVNRLCFNISKTSILIFDRETNAETLTIPIPGAQSIILNETKLQKYLGLVIDSQLSFQDHIDYVKSKVAKRIGALYKSKSLLPLKYRKMFVNALMLPQFDYLDIIWCRAGKTKLNAIDVLYKKVAKIALDVDVREPSLNVYKNMNWLPLHLRRQLHLSTYMYKIVNEIAPPQFLNKFAYVSGGSRDAEKCNLYTPKDRSHKSFSYLGTKCWNSIPLSIRTAETDKKFSEILKSSFMNEVCNNSSYQANNKFDYFYEIEKAD